MAFAVYENFEKGYGLCYNNKCRPLLNVILAVAVTQRPPPNDISAVALSHCQSVIRQWPVGYHFTATAETAFGGGHHWELFFFCARFAPYFFNCMLCIVHVTTQINSLHSK